MAQPEASITRTHMQVLPANSEDVLQLSDIHLRAWLTNRLYSTIYYGGYSQVLLNANIERHNEALLNDHSSRYLKCVLSSSPENSEIIAWAKINVFTTIHSVEERKDTSERIWPPGINRSLVTSFWSQLQALRSKYGPKLGPHLQVDLVATDPVYFRRGAGMALMTEIAKIADQENLPSFIEGSPEGERLYGNAGFIKIGDFWIDIGRFPDGGDLGKGWRKREGESEKTDVDGWYKQVLMIRPAKGKSIAHYLGEGWEGRRNGNTI